MSRERDIRNAMRDLLLATGQFDDVLIGRDSEEYAAAAIGRTANISPHEDKSKALWDTGNELEVFTKVRVTFTGRDEDPQLRDEAAERLYNAARNVLNDVSLASLTLPDFTRFESAKWSKPTHPSRQIEAIFSFRYFSSSTSFDTAE